MNNPYTKNISSSVVLLNKFVPNYNRIRAYMYNTGEKSAYLSVFAPTFIYNITMA